MSQKAKHTSGPTEYPIGDVPGLTMSQVLAVAQAGFRTAADLHRAAFKRAKANRMVDAQKSAEAMVAILVRVFGGDVDQAASVATAIRVETRRRLASFNEGGAL